MALMLGLAGTSAAMAQASLSVVQADADARALVAHMTLSEKVAQLQDQAPAIPRLGVPAYGWWSEGLHGLARNGYATVFPQAIGLAASWDPALLGEVGRITALEARASVAERHPALGYPRFGGLTIWSPNVNIFRDPRWGRGQETYGEDPLLTARLAVAYIQGLQGPDPEHPVAVATPKHFDAHSGPEGIRHQFDARVSAHDLEDTYLPAFRASITEGQADAVMCSYNALNGIPTCANQWLLGQTLRGDWHFRGMVVSDCDAVDDMTAFHHYTHDDAEASALALQAGTDLDCGNAYAHLEEAVRRGEVSEALLDQALVRLFSLRERLGLLQTKAPPPALPMPSLAQRQALALRAAEESIVLLKNQHGVLPLKPGSRIAVIGPTADMLGDMEANYHGTPRQVVTPLQGLRQLWGAGAIRYAQGSQLAEGIAAPVPETQLFDDAGRPGLQVDYYAQAAIRGRPVRSGRASTLQVDLDHVNPVDPTHPEAAYAIRWHGQIELPSAGDYRLGVGVARCFDCRGHDRVRLLLDGQPLLDGSTDQPDVPVHVTTGGRHRLEVELVHSGEDQGLVLRWQVPGQVLWPQARQAAEAADVIVAMVGLSQDMEGEQLQTSTAGFDHGDRVALDLPAPQAHLLQQLATLGKPLVVVNLSGGAVALNWSQQHADALLQAWYPGEQGGTALARILGGQTNPSGRLPVTVYRDAAQLPPYQDYAMRGRTYRYFTGTPLYRFGEGMSYSRFSMGAVTAPTRLAAGDDLALSVAISNDSRRSGDDVVEVYLRPPASALNPRWMLVGFQRVHLDGGQRTTVRIRLPARALSLVDAAGRRAVNAGQYQLILGDGAPEDRGEKLLPLEIHGNRALPR
ncbi:glycoside hydrolase family 3 C-terminal domain-containing protein [Frateuria aurantia]